MIPILYSPSMITEGSVPAHFGIGSLTDCIEYKCSEDHNGKYEMNLTYPANGIHADQIQYGSFIKAKPNFTDNPQLFQVIKVGKTMSGQFSVYCQHVSYLLSGKVISSGTAGSATAACLLLTGSAGGFTITTDKNVAADFTVTEPSSVRSWFGGKKGSLLDVYGTAEWHYDNFTCSLLAHRGADRGVQIRYGKNLTQLSQEINMENLCTGIIPFCIAEDGTKTVGTKVSTGLTLDFPRDKAVDFTDDVDFASATPVATQLATLASNYISNNNFTDVFNSITLDFVQLSNLQERVDLCDTVHIYFEALGITATLKCVSCTWDGLAERYTSCTFGDMRSSIADTIVTQEKQIAEKPSVSTMNSAIKMMTDLISGNLGGYVINGHDSNGDGYPDENLIMDTPDISTATNVIRSNLGGIGFSTNGYIGPYQTALGFGGIVADAITTGTLNANLIKAGVLSDANGNSTIDMTTGVAKLYQLIARLSFDVIDSSNNTLAHFGANAHGGAYLDINNGNGDKAVRASAGEYQDGYIDVYDNNNNVAVSLVGGTGGGGHIEQSAGVKELWDGESYTTDIDIANAYGTYSSYLIYGRVDTGGSFISVLIPRTMLTTNNQKFVLADDTKYITFYVKYDGTTLKISHNTKNAMGCLLKVYGIY